MSKSPIMEIHLDSNIMWIYSARHNGKMKIYIRPTKKYIHLWKIRYYSGRIFQPDGRP